MISILVKPRVSALAGCDNKYQRETFQNDSEDSLTSTMMLLALAINQLYSTPTNNRLRSSSNTRNQAVVQAKHKESSCCASCEKGHYAHNCPKTRVRDSKYFMEQMLLEKKDEARVILSNFQ
ncbi:hypothetical protein Tco_0880704 [Tanacetum coccineum]